MLSFLDIVILVVLTIGLWRGFQLGLMRSLVGLFGWLFALVLATFFAKPLAPMFADFFDNEISSIVASFLAVAILVLTLLQLILWVMSRALKGLKLSFLDKLAGAMFGFGKNALAVLLLISVVAPFVQQTNFWQNSQIAKSLLPLAPFAVDLSKQISEKMRENGQKGLDELNKVSKQAGEIVY